MTRRKSLSTEEWWAETERSVRRAGPSKNVIPHPLEEVVLGAFAKNDHQDLTTISVALGACSHPARGARAYRTVAEDVLGYMAHQGKIRRDSSGWLHLVKAAGRTRDGEPR